MTKIYFVRHAEPLHSFEDDRTRPLTEEGIDDSKKVLKRLSSTKIDCVYSSPYKRSIDTIKACADSRGLKIITDERLREREKGVDGNIYGMFEKRWADFNFHEMGGESLLMVQKRNVEALFKIIRNNENKSILIGTHGTALSMILNYFYPSFICKDFLRIIDYMPYIIRLDFVENECVDKKELLVVEKEYNGKIRADRKLE